MPRKASPAPLRSRRTFLAEVGRGMLVTTVGYDLARDLGLAHALADSTVSTPGSLSFGPLEPLVQLMQDTEPDRLLPLLANRLRTGTSLRELTTAAALANARTFGGEDYVGYHTLMALAPAFHMSADLPDSERPLPVLKVLYRNTTRIREHGGRPSEILKPVPPSDAPKLANAESLRNAIRDRDLDSAEKLFGALAAQSPETAFNALLEAVQDGTEVHRVVLPYRAWDMLGIIGKDQAQTLLRQSVRYCVRAESWTRSTAMTEPRRILPQLLEQHRLLDRTPGARTPDDAWIDQFSQTLFKSTPANAADAAAAALAEGIAPDAIGEAITLAANQLILRDYGRTPREESPGKPVGSVHGDSIGVHACDSANAWRNMARVANPRNTCASLILGAFQVALDRTNRGGDFLNWQPIPDKRYLGEIQSTSPEDLLRDAEAAIRANLQIRASAAIQRYGDLGHAPGPVFALLVRYATSEDGSLHAEKFYRTASEEFHHTRPPFRWRHLVALARVTASEFGRPAPGIAQARELLRLS